MGNMGLNLSKVPAALVATAGKPPVVSTSGECDLQRWQPDWVAISYVHKRIAIIDLCRPSDVHEDQLEVAATLKQDGCSPLIRALDFYTKQGWIIHVFPFLMRIRGLLHPSHICALLQFSEVPHKHWLPAVKGAVHASVNASTFYIVCVLVAFLSEVCLELVLARPTWERILLTLLIWMNPGWLGTDASVDHPGVTVLEPLPSEDLSD